MNIVQLITLILGAAAAILGRSVDLTEDQILALAVALGGVYQLVARWVLHRQADDLGLPDPRAFYGVTTSWLVLANAILAIVVFAGGAPAVLPAWVAPVAQLLAFVVGQMRLNAAGARLGQRHKLRPLNRVAQWRKL